MAEILERIKNNDISDDEREKIIKLFTPKVPYNKKPENRIKIRDRRRERYQNDEEYREKIKTSRLEYYHKINDPKPKQRKGAKIKYQTEEQREEQRLRHNEYVRNKYQERTKDAPRKKTGRKPMTLEEKIQRLRKRFSEKLDSLN